PSRIRSQYTRWFPGCGGKRSCGRHWLEPSSMPGAGCTGRPTRMEDSLVSSLASWDGTAGCTCIRTCSPSCPSGDREGSGTRPSWPSVRPGAVVELPPDHSALRAGDAALGLEWRETSARAFQACFDAGLAAAWIDRQGRYVFLPAKELMA